MTISLKDVGSGYKRSAINSNFQAIEDEINNNLLSKNGGVGLEAALDANSQRIINLANGVQGKDAVNLEQLNAILSANSTGIIASQLEVQYGNQAINRVFTFSNIAYVQGGNNLFVFRNGQKLGISEDYTETSTGSITLTFDPNDDDRFEFITNISLTTTLETTTANITHSNGGINYPLNGYIDDITKNFSTLAEAIADPGLAEGNTLSIKERTSGNGGGGTWDVVLASTVTPNTYNIIQSTGVGSLALVLRVGDVINVKQFGAVGDGVVDDTAAMQHCMDTITSDQAMYFPEGRYLVSSRITIRNACTYYGDGESISRIVSAGFADHMWYISLAGGAPSRNLIKDMGFVHLGGVGSAADICAIYYDSVASFSSFRNLIFSNVGADPTWSVCGLRVKGSINGIVDCTFTAIDGVSNVGCYLQGDSNRVVGCWFDEFSGRGLDIAGKRNIVSSNNFQDSTSTMIYVLATAIDTVVVSNTLFNDNATYSGDLIRNEGENTLVSENIFKTSGKPNSIVDNSTDTVGMIYNGNFTTDGEEFTGSQNRTYYGVLSNDQTQDGENLYRSGSCQYRELQLAFATGTNIGGITNYNNTAKIRHNNSDQWEVTNEFKILGTSAGRMLIFGSGTGVSVYTGTGSPEGVISAIVGSTYHRTDGGAGTSFYVKESGTNNTGWVAK